MYFQPKIELTPEEILDYLRKSQSDDPTLTVEEVLAKHEALLDEWAEKHVGGKVPEENKFREVVSGETLKERPEIQKVLRLIESPKIKAVKMVEPQRLTRGDLEDIGRVMKLFKHTNTLVITLDRIYDLRDEYDWNAFEAELKRGNDYLKYTKKILNRGKDLAVMQGHYIATFPPLGYDKIQIPDESGKKKCKTLRPNADADTVRMIFDLYVNKNYTPQKICDYLDSIGIKPVKGKHWSAASMKDLLSNVHYIGKTRWNWRKTVTIVEDGVIKKTRPRTSIDEYMIFEGKHEAIISEEIFYAAQEKRGKNPRYPAKKKHVNPLTTILFCECGRAMSLRPYPNSQPRFICQGIRHCNNSSCTYQELVDELCSVLEKCIADFEIRIEANEGDSVKLHAALVKNLEKKLERLKEKELAQWEAQTDSVLRMPPEIFKQLNEKLLAEKEEVQQALCKAYESMPEPVNYEEKLYRFRDALNALKDDSVPVEEKNKLLRACIERITYRRDKKKRIPKEDGKYVAVRDGGGWNNPPFYIDVKLRV